MTALLKLLKYLKKYKPAVFLSLFLLLIATSLTIIQPKIIEWAIDYGIQVENINNIILGAVAILLAALIGSGFNIASGYMLIKSAQGLGYDLRNDLYLKIMSFSFANLDKWRTGELMVRMNTDVTTIKMFIRMGLLMIIQAIIMLIGSLFIMFFTNIKLATIMAIIMTGVMVIFFLVAVLIRPLFKKMRQRLDKLNNVLQENLAGAKVVRAFTSQQYEIQKYRQKNQDLLKISLKVGYIISILFPFMFLFGQLALTATLWVGGIDVINNLLGSIVNGLTLGQLIAFNNYAIMVMFPLLMLGMILNFISMAAASAERIEELLKQVPTIREQQNPIEFDNIDGKIEFKDVCFYYGQGENACNQINLTINPGEKIGVLGTTGSGKSSLAHLIPRFYDPQQGEIKINNHNIKRLSLAGLRTKIALVLQDTILFSGTIRQNISFGNPQADDKQLTMAAEMACALEFINHKEQKWDELIGERGKGLSGGQRQRVAIARAIAANPDILILDDATSSVDVATERKIIENLYNNLDKKTIIIISQKINTIMQADRIIVMDNGEIVDVGTHKQLLKQSKIYKEIYDTQSMQLKG